MKILFTLACSLFICMHLSSQNGLEKIIVEKYYISDENDKTVDGDGGELPVNSVTYRVYVDMLPGYIFQAAFGTPEHEMKIASSTRFFNNEDRGAGHPTYTRAQAQKNTVMLDSWLSVGAAMKDYAGVLKHHDNSVNTIVNSDGVLQNEHPEAGIPIKAEDGAVLATVQPVTVVGFSDTDLTIFESSNDAPIPSVMSTRDGAWSSLAGSRGADTTENIVLIGQFTTDGIFEFELNLQIRNQQTLGVEKYVARNPVADEILFETLIHIDSLGLISSTDESINITDEITAFPNPTSGNLSFQIDQQIPLIGVQNQYMLKSVNGDAVMKGKITDHLTSIDISHLSPGVYVLLIDLDHIYKASKKIIVTP